MDTKWREYHREYEKLLQLIELPSYAFNLKSYWIQYDGGWCIRKGKTGCARTCLPTPPGLESTTLQHALQHCSTLTSIKANINSPSLILLPNGAGSLAPYTLLPQPSIHLSVSWGSAHLSLTNQSTYNLSLVETSTIFSDTILHAVPTERLVLGGLSIEGVFAHEVAKQLPEKGRKVRGLLLLNTPCPQTVPAIKPGLPLRIIDVLQELCRFKRAGRKDAKLPPNAREHFLRNAIVLERHHPSPPSAAARQIPCVAIWAARGALDSLDEA